MSRRFCIRGHDTHAVGRTSSHNCRECLRAWDRERNRRRRLDPAYQAAEERYKANWSLDRGYLLSLGRSTIAKIEQMHDLFAMVDPPYVEIMRKVLGPLPEPRAPHDGWNGDPHSLKAPPYRYRSRRNYPRVTKETVEAIARESRLVQMVREQRGIRAQG